MRVDLRRAKPARGIPGGAPETTQRFTVVIPAFNNAHTLPRVLTALSEQDAPLRVVVVDDGSTDGTVKVVKEIAAQWPDGLLTIVTQEHQGAAAARNVGAALASAGDLLLFLGADIIPDPSCLRHHLAVHRQYPEDTVGCLGFVTWDPALSPSPFMVFLEHGGPQNAYGEIAGQDWVAPAHYCYAANLSLKAAMFSGVGGFDAERFPTYGWEDLALGMKLAGAGFRLYYEPTARAVHQHPMTVVAAEARMRVVGQGAQALHAAFPDTGVLNLPRERRVAPLRRWCFPPPVRWLLRRLAQRAERQSILPRLYRRVLSLAFYDGVHAPVESSKNLWKN